MEVKKKYDGYTIEVSREEYERIIMALDAAETLCDEHGSRDNEERYRALRFELEKGKVRNLRKEEVEEINRCFVCKNCLPPILRENGSICRLSECKFDPA